MAEVEDIPQDLRGLARRVPPLTRAALTRFDLGSRCEAAAVLITEADQESDPLRAHRKRSQAGRLLAAMTPEAYSAEVGRLRDELEEAKRRGDDQSAWQAGEDLRELDRRHPQVPAEKVLDQAVAAFMTGVEKKARLSVPSLPAGHLWSRRNRKHQRGR